MAQDQPSYNEQRHADNQARNENVHGDRPRSMVCTTHNRRRANDDRSHQGRAAPAGTSLHQRLNLAPKRLPRGIARVEHVAAGIDGQFHPAGGGIGRQLVEDDL